MPSEIAIGEWRNPQIERIAGRQLHLITLHQLGTAGMPASTIRDGVGSGRLFRMHDGVYATHSPPHTQEQRWLAAVLACGRGSMLSDWPAVAHWGIATDVPTVVPHVTVPGSRGRTLGGIAVHRRGVVDPRDFALKDSIPIT